MLAFKTIPHILFAFARSRSGRIPTATSIINGASSPIVPIRCFKRTALSSNDDFWNDRIQTVVRRSVSEDQSDDPDFETNENYNDRVEFQHNWLVCGDGDFSYSAAIAEDLAEKNIQLVATVLEDENVHDSVYKRSSQNKAAVLSYPKRTNEICMAAATAAAATPQQSQHKVRFGIDATRLEDFFPSEKFRTIEFNFPHWGGKTNAKRNRQLLDGFMASACKVLHDEGEITISLCEGQGGFPVSTIDEWKQSWLVPEYAAEHGLLLRKLSPYEPSYQQTSHRGKDRPWIKDGTAQRYTFTFPNQNAIDSDLQMSCRHELRIVLPPASANGPGASTDDILEGDAVFQHTKNFVPAGIRMEVVEREILRPYVFNGEEVTLAIFLLNYSGERMPLTRRTADSIRAQLEESVRREWGFEIAKSGRLVSRPYPTHLLPSLVKESYVRKAKLNNINK